MPTICVFRGVRAENRRVGELVNASNKPGPITRPYILLYCNLYQWVYCLDPLSSLNMS